MAPKWTPAPIDHGAAPAHACAMHTQITPTPSPAAGLAAASREFETPAGRATATHEVAATLADIEEALTALERSCTLAASALLPAGDGICDRYQRAAERWPDGLEPPSHERQAAIASALHDTGSKVRAAVHSCRRACDLLRETGA
jgi:hypothetical protein